MRLALQEMAAGLLAERADAGAADCGVGHVDVVCWVLLYWGGVGCVGEGVFVLPLRKSRCSLTRNGDLTIGVSLTRSQGSQSERLDAAATGLSLDWERAVSIILVLITILTI